MDKSTIYFFKKSSQVPPGSIVLNWQNAEEVIEAFNQRELRSIYVSFHMVSGWSTKLSGDECDVVFLDGDWSVAQIAQAEARVRSKLLS